MTEQKQHNLYLTQFARKPCPHCGTVTVQVLTDAQRLGREAWSFQGTCVQCIADGGTCCSLSRFNRWEETT